MSQKQNPNIQYEGINSNGNKYTVYNDGRYRYVNVNAEGKNASSYYNAGNGHAFFRKNDPEKSYSFHENANKGYRDYKFKVPAENGHKSNAKDTKSVHISW